MLMGTYYTPHARLSAFSLLLLCLLGSRLLSRDCWRERNNDAIRDYCTPAEVVSVRESYFAEFVKP